MKNETKKIKNTRRFILYRVTKTEDGRKKLNKEKTFACTAYEEMKKYTEEISALEWVFGFSRCKQVFLVE